MILYLLACSSESKDAGNDAAGDTGSVVDTGEPGWGYEPDPDVSTWLPEDYRATAPGRVIFLGDSITDGTGASSGSLDYPSLLVENDPETWPGWDEYDLTSLFGDLETIDVSRGGATTDDVVDSQLSRLSGEVGDTVTGESVVAITIGGNDLQAALARLLGADDPEAEYEEIAPPVLENLRAIMQYFNDAERFPDGAYLYMTNVYEPTDGEWYAEGCFYDLDLSAILPLLDRFNGEGLAVAQEEGVAWVDLRGHFLGHGHNYDDSSNTAYDSDDPTLWLDDDCIHPNDRGHHELRRLFLTAMDGRPLEAPGEVP